MSEVFPDELADESGEALQRRYQGLLDEERAQPGWGSSYTMGEGMDPEVDLSDVPVFMSKKFAREFYWNGPTYNAWDHHQVEMNQIQAVVSSYTEPRKKAALDSFQGLLSKYGHTNSPGTLWALAQSGLNPDSDAIKSLLNQDAKVAQAEHAALAPTTASAVSPDEVDEGFGLWTVPQFIARNAFAALSMPLEATQGAMRAIGGEVAEAVDQAETGNYTFGDAFESTKNVVAAGLSLSPILAPFVDGLLVADDDLQNPWEQTYGGQTMLAAARNPESIFNPFNPAYGTQQAGLNTAEAEKLLQDDPRYSEQRQRVIDDPQQLNTVVNEIAKENGLYSGPGWFIEENSIVGEAQVKSTFDAWTIPGKDGALEAWTLGRGIVGATAGPDWAGYGIASGVIDAIAAVGGDPAVFASKLGLTGKTIRGAGMLLSASGEAARAKDVAAGLKYVKDTGRSLGAAEKALTFGREAKKVRTATGLMNRNVNDFVDEYNRLSAQPGGPLEGKQMTSAEFEAMTATDQATAVRMMREAQVAEEAYQSAAPSVNSVAEYAAAQRVANARLALLRAAQETSGSDRSRLGRTVQLWSEYEAATRVASTEAGNTYNLNLAGEWLASLSPEDAEIITQSAKHINKLLKRAKKEIDVERDPQAAGRLFAKAQEYYQKKLNAVTKDRELSYADEVDGQAARLILTNQAEKALTELNGINYAGLVVPDQINPDDLRQMQRGVYNGNDVIMGWKKPDAPVYKNANDIISDEEANQLSTFIDEIQQRDGMQFNPFTLSPDEIDALPGTIAKQIEDIENPFGFLKELVGQQDVTYLTVFDAMQRRGLGYQFGEFMAAQGWDALWGVNRRTGNGAWFPDVDGLTEIYKFPDSALQNAEQAAGMIDGVDDFLKSLPQTAEPVGFMNLTREQIDDIVLDGERAVNAATATRETKRNAALVLARAGQERINAGKAALDNKFADPARAMREIIGYNMGMALSGAKGATVTPENVRWFMFGSGPLAAVKAKAFDVLGNIMSETDRAKFANLVRGSDEWNEVYASVAPRYLGQLRQITSNKWDSETYKAVLDNSINGNGVDGLVTILAPRLGLDVQKGSIQAGLKSSDQDGLRTLTTWRTSDAKIKRAIARQAGERPGTRTVQLDRSSDVVDAVIKYGMYAKIAPSKLNEYIGKITLNDGTFGMAAANVDVLKSLFNDISDSLIDNLDQSSVLFKGDKGQARKGVIADAIRTSTRLFLGGETDQTASAAQRVGAGDAALRYIGDDGASVDMPDIMFDSELATGYLTLPNVDDWQAAISRVGTALARWTPVEGAYDFSRRMFDNFFRTGLLIFRGAYILRNSAEMQIRLFLNGHQSVFNDPVSMVGMVLGNPKVMGKFTPKGKFFENSYGRYQQTILDTDFEVGLDEAAAFANHVEDYWALTRQANSLTDPRVYQYGIRKGWQTIGLDTPQFASGWANELIMLHRSDLARAVLGDIPFEYRGARGAGVTSKQSVVNWLLSNSESALSVRQKLIAADDKYAQIFASPSVTEDYLFNSVNSVLNRVKQFTMDDPILVDFIKTGRWVDDAGEFNIRTVPNLKDRVTGLQTRIKKRFWEGGKPNAAVVDRMGNGKVVVPWIDGAELRKGAGWIDGFFKFANKIERLGTVGPEFRMAYWDKIAEMAPALSPEYVDRALKAADTTLSGLQRMRNGKLVNVGSKHPAWRALEKAKKENSGGMLTLDDLHSVATEYASGIVKDLFYDAARRNNFWSATRLIFPFGQAWGNTVTEWAALGARNPIKIYEAQKAFNAGMMPGSQEIYEAGDILGVYGDYQEGMAPWDQDPNGGFFFQNQFGDYDFVMPLAGRMQGLSTGVLSAFNGLGFNVPQLENTSPLSSANLALGGAEDNPIAGLSPFIGVGLNFLPDENVIENMQALANPFGPQAITQSAIPSWAQSIIAGVGGIPIIGESVGPFISGLAPARKNKMVLEAAAILADSGRYDLEDPISVAALKEDATNLGSSFLLITGFGQNISPTAPQGQYSVGEVGLGFLSRLYPLYLTESGGDSVGAKTQMAADFGLPTLFALTGNRKGFSRVPSSEARQWARASSENMELVKAFPDEFSLFFTEGDPSDATARAWIEGITQEDRRFKNSDEIINDVISLLGRVRRQRVEDQYNKGVLNDAQFEQAKEDVKAMLADTDVGMEFSSQTDTQRLERVKSLYDRSESIRGTKVGRTFAEAWAFREEALSEVRRVTGEEDATLGREKAAPLKEAYIRDLDALLLTNPDFKVLHNMMTREWD